MVTRPSAGRAVLAERYSIEEMIGSGGMGVVFGGWDLRTGEAIAVKRLHTRFYGDRRMRLLMAHEVRAMARLRHPGIVRVIDFGFEQGAPYVVMERVRGRPLSVYIERPLGWAALRALGIAVLRTLAHAHARGVVHLDLKPANVLVAGAGDVKLVDFGIARVLERDEGFVLPDEEGRVMGSRGFMAPEQAAGDEGRIGPASDLFAVGVTLYLLASGKLPFAVPARGRPVEDLARRVPRALVARRPLPEAAVEVIADLLVGDAVRRGDFAADFVRRLEAIPADGEAELPETPPEEAGRPLTGELTCVFTTPTEVWTHPAGDEDEEATRAMGPAGTERMDGTRLDGRTLVERSGARGAVAGPSSQTSGTEAGSGVAPVSGAAPVSGTPAPASSVVGTLERGEAGVRSRWGLFGIREPALAGRAKEQGFLLEPAVEVLQGRAARVRILRGEAGAGKSRLARWVMERSRDDGSFLGLVAAYGRGRGGGVRGALSGWLRAGNASQRELVDRAIERIGCSSVEAWSLASVLRPGDRRPDRAAKEIVATLVTTLRSLSRLRPVLLWIDDADASAGGSAYLLIEALLAADARAPLPIYVVATEGGSLPAAAAQASEGLRAHAAVRTAEVGRLDEDALASIARDLLPLDRRTLREVVPRAEGNPLHLVQLLAHWVETGKLSPAGDGELSGPSWSGLPEVLPAVMEARIDGLADLSGDRALAIEVLERIALLGRGLDVRVLHRTLALEGRADAGEAEAAVERWLSAGVLRAIEPGVVEIEPHVLEQPLAERARCRMGHAAVQRACAEAKRELVRGGELHPALRGEIALHLLAGDRAEEAAAEAIEAGRRAPQYGLADAGLGFLAIADRCLAALATPPDRLIARHRLALTVAQFRTGQKTAAPVSAREGVAAARRAAEPETLAMALIVEGDLLRRTGKPDEAIRSLQEAAELGRQHALSEALARASYSLAHLAYLRADLERARTLVDDAQAAARRAGEAWTAIWASSLRRAIALARGDLRGALADLKADRLEAEAHGFPSVLAQMDQHAGEIHLSQGDHAQALEHFTRARSVIALFADLQMDVALELDRAAALLGLGRAADAEASAVSAEGMADRLGFPTHLRTAAVYRFHAAVLDQDWPRASAQLARLEETEEEQATMEVDVARSLYRAGTLAMAHGRRDLERRSYRRALVHLRRLKSEAEVRVIEESLGLD